MSFEIFVPGRVCLVGEHSDWAGGYRKINKQLEKGCCLLTGTNQGIYATASKNPTDLVVSAVLDSNVIGHLSLPMNEESLRSEIEKGNIWSYICGVCYEMLKKYNDVQGLVLDNYKTDLPVRKGLSSSAAICVLTARAFSEVYSLALSHEEEMELAYLGERRVGSQCGRMDQALAFGQRPVVMNFDRDCVDVTLVECGGDIFMVIVDLCRSKDTKRILEDLNSCFPFPQNEIHGKVHEALGVKNKEIVYRSIDALRTGDAKKLGSIMIEAQKTFDDSLVPVCPGELTAPALHEVLSYGPISHLIYGGKCVGSGGDGCAQLVARSKEAREEVQNILENDLKVVCLPLDIQSTQ